MLKFTFTMVIATIFFGFFFLGCKITRPHYDSNVGYEFDNNDKDFVEIAGDFHKLKYSPEHTIMITCWYHQNAYRDYEKLLEAAIQIPQKTVPLVGDSPIIVTSNNFGSLELMNYKSKEN